MHHIQKHILRTLTYTKKARFSDMRPPKVDSNLYSYHLRVLLSEGLVEKVEAGYRLSPSGLAYVDRISVEKFEPRIQPKIITMLLAKNESGDVLLWNKKKQPFIGTWSLPNGKIHIQDESIEKAAIREASEKMNIDPASLHHAGVCSIRAFINKELVSYVLAHIFLVSIEDESSLSENTRWCSETVRRQLKLGPATEQIIQKATTADRFFFESYDIDW